MRREIALNDLDRAGLLDSQEALFVARLRANDDAAYDELVRAYHAGIFQTACRMLGDATESADIVQDIFVKVFRSIGGFRGDSSLKTWIYRIALSEVLNRLRSWRRRFRAFTVSVDDNRNGEAPCLQLPANGLSPLQALECREREEAIAAALKKLSEEHRSIVILRDIEGFSYTEIAEILGITAGTVKSRLARARAEMKNSLARFLSIQRIES